MTGVDSAQVEEAPSGPDLLAHRPPGRFRFEAVLSDHSAATAGAAATAAKRLAQEIAAGPICDGATVALDEGDGHGAEGRVAGTVRAGSMSAGDEAVGRLTGLFSDAVNDPAAPCDLDLRFEHLAHGEPAERGPRASEQPMGGRAAMTADRP